jgi:hypothetical protein
MLSGLLHARQALAGHFSDLAAGLVAKMLIISAK